jgi:hypothetical protein
MSVLRYEYSVKREVCISILILTDLSKSGMLLRNVATYKVNYLSLL